MNKSIIYKATENKEIQADLRKLESLQKESCEDAISRKELLKAIDTWDKFGCDADTKLVQYQNHYIPYIHYDDVVNCIKGMPSVNPQEQKTGHWIRVTDKTDHWVWECDNCGWQQRFNTTYCPDCGCCMVESEG